MRNRKSGELFTLIKGMTKWEKKNFYHYATRNIGDNNLKVLMLYKAINTMDHYDERKLLSRLKHAQIKHLPNLKVNLYNLVLDSLRLAGTEGNISLQLHQLMDHARILYDKAFYVPALKTLKRLKSVALEYHQISFAFQAVVMEKKIVIVHGDCEGATIEVLNKEMDAYSKELSLIGELSNISMLLYGCYKKYGVIRNGEDEKDIKDIFHSSSIFDGKNISFYPKLYLLQLRTYFYLLTNESDLLFREVSAWVALFDKYTAMKGLEQLQYVRGLAYLSEASLQTTDIRTALTAAELLRSSKDDFYRLLSWVNLCLLKNHPDNGLIEEISSTVKAIKNDERKLILSHKAAQLCLNCGKYECVIDFTNTAINLKSSPRFDLCYSVRLLHVEAHKRLGNEKITEYLELSVRRFAKSHQFL